MAKTSIWFQTESEKLGTVDGMNLFFGALLGANLGTLGTLPLHDYVLLITLLAGLVVTIRLVHLSERRLYALATHLFYVMMVALAMFLPTMRPEGLSDGDRDRLVATIAVWVALTLVVEFWPARQAREDEALES